MNFTDKWLKESAVLLTNESEDVKVSVIPTCVIVELLKTHAIVPREPSNEALINQAAWNLGKSTRNTYKAMIKAAENDQ